MNKTFAYLLTVPVSVAMVILCSLLMAGCAVAPSSVQEMRVPITQKCKIQAIQKPAMPFDDTAAKSMSLFNKTQLLLAQDENLKGYVISLTAALDNCSEVVTVK